MTEAFPSSTIFYLLSKLIWKVVIHRISLVQKALWCLKSAFSNSRWILMPKRVNHPWINKSNDMAIVLKHLLREIIEDLKFINASMSWSWSRISNCALIQNSDLLKECNRTWPGKMAHYKTWLITFCWISGVMWLCSWKLLCNSVWATPNSRLSII